jgi:pimeloyl-ACP methyl ester carboxylesterase
MKTVLFVPGFRETLTSRDYKSTLTAIKKKGYKVKFVPINWTRTTINDWIVELDKEYARHNPDETILAGFSYGAMAAFMSAAKTNPAQLWLFSFSPYFSDDIHEIKKSWLNNIGHRRADAFRALDFNALAQKVTCPTLLITGEAEASKYPLMGRRSRIAREKIADSRLVWVPECGHDVTDKRYIEAVTKAI